jgi:hypothetical protein
MKRFYFTPEQEQELRRLHPDMPNEDIAKHFGCKPKVIHNKAHKMGLKKSPEYINSCGIIFHKGDIPHNKGKKQAEYMTPDAVERSAKSRFKKGHLPKNTRKDYDIRVETRKDGRPYQFIRIAKAKWVPLARYVWEMHNGPIPEGHNIQFKDGDTLNCEIGNLYMISRSDQLKYENSFHARYPEEIKQLIQLKGALHRQINKATKKNKPDGND